ncbi:hypothetical protein K474DRAFT_1652757 [Panus rudis PR-1116 ss-1]|nr:hypothetical protein K474DRAFT_1652757 [Panus rudis PR-1116 ss-1]
MSDFGTPPEIPAELQQYNSYVTDPQWQRRFTIIWTSVLGLVVVLSLPRLVRAIRAGRAFVGLFGIWGGSGYVPIRDERTDGHGERRVRRGRSGLVSVTEKLAASFGWTLPGLELTLAQGTHGPRPPPLSNTNSPLVLVIAAYLAVLLVCVTAHVPLLDNPNRAGFLALAQFPLLFLFSTKNSILSLLLGPGHGYEKLNYVHRSAGRGMFIAAVVHGALWVWNHLQYGIQILGAQKETSGVAALGVLSVLVLTSLRPLRRCCYQAFFVVHVLGFVAFFVTICYHTPYASPWIFPPLALYGLDLFLRLLRYRIKEASLVAVDQNMTLIHIHDCDGGWQAGQHVRLRVFFGGGRIFESHPLTIMNAPGGLSCSPDDGNARTITLAARVCGDWTRALNAYAREERDRLNPTHQPTKPLTHQPTVPIQIMLDGPYGGCSLDLGLYDDVLLVAGGSGAAFTVGVLDELVGRWVREREIGGRVRTKRVEFVWCVRSFGCIEWFAPALTRIAHAARGSSSNSQPALDLHISIYVTCLCNPSSLPCIPGMDVYVDGGRPKVLDLLRRFEIEKEEEVDVEAAFTSHSPSKPNRLNGDNTNEGDLAVCVAGPESLVREAQNAVARFAIGELAKGERGRGVAIHTELFAL